MPQTFWYLSRQTRPFARWTHTPFCLIPHQSPLLQLLTIPHTAHHVHSSGPLDVSVSLPECPSYPFYLEKPTPTHPPRSCTNVILYLSELYPLYTWHILQRIITELRLRACILQSHYLSLKCQLSHFLVCDLMYGPAHSVFSPQRRHEENAATTY